MKVTVKLSLERFKELEKAEETLKQITDTNNPDKPFMIVMTYGRDINYFPIESQYTKVLSNFKSLLEKNGIYKDYPEQL